MPTARWHVEPLPWTENTFVPEGVRELGEAIHIGRFDVDRTHVALGIDAGAAALFRIEARRLTRVEEVPVGKRSGRRDEHSHARRRSILGSSVWASYACGEGRWRRDEHSHARWRSILGSRHDRVHELVADDLHEHVII